MGKYTKASGVSWIGIGQHPIRYPVRDIRGGCNNEGPARIPASDFGVNADRRVLRGLEQYRAVEALFIFKRGLLFILVLVVQSNDS